MTTESYDTAVLFVHGIGEQQQGATLTEHGGALVGAAREWFGAENVEDLPLEEDPRDGEPQRRAVLLTRPGEAPLRLLLAESHWAGEVRAPAWRALMRWLGTTVPFLVQRAVDAGMRRSSRAIDDNTRLLPMIAFGALRIVQNVMAVAMALLVVIVLFAIGLLSGLGPVRERLFGPHTTRPFPAWARLLAFLTLVPIGWGLVTYANMPLKFGALILVAVIPVVVLMSLSGRLRGLVVGFIGDSYALLHADGRRNAIVDRVSGDLAKLEADVAGTPVIIAAHSQGAEIARRVLRDRPADAAPVAGLVTFGAGIAKLRAVESLRQQSRSSWFAFGLRWISAVCAVCAVVVLAVSLRSEPVLACGAALALFAIAATTLHAARLVLQRIIGVSIDAAALQVDARHVAHWTDLHASHDPVSEGDLPVADTHGFSRTIVNRGSLMHDHVAYTVNHVAFLTVIALEIERVVGGYASPARPPALAELEAARARMIDAIGSIRNATVVLVAGLWIAFTPSVLVCAAMAAVAAGVLVSVSAALHTQAEARTRKAVGAHAAAAKRRPAVAA